MSSGFPRVRETCRQIGIEFDGWQTDLNRCILAKTADGLFAADTVVLSISRQVGKTFDIGAIVFAACIADPGTTVIWTAHNFKVARETFNDLRSLAKTPKLAPHIDYDAITTAAGNECIPFRNGSRIMFAARERGAIRGFTKVKILVLDEAQILTEAALADLAPTMNQAENPQIILMGTPPKPSDPSEVFTNLRAAALAGDSEGLLYVEFSADPGSDPDDRDAWRKANPSYPTRTKARAIVRLRKLLSHADFLREALGIWDSDSVRGVIAAPVWEACKDAASQIISDPVFVLDVSPNYSTAAIAAAGRRVDGLPHVEITSNSGVLDHREGTDWIVPRCVDIKSRTPNMVVWIAAGSAAESLKPDLEAAGIPVFIIGRGDVAAACGQFYTKATAGQLRHIGQPALAEALGGAQKQVEDGEGAWRWGRRKSSSDITPLYAATLALWVASSASMHPVNNVW